MNHPDNHSDLMGKFESDLRAWASRPTGLTPDEAAQSIRDRLPDRQRTLLSRPYAFIPVCTVVCLICLWFFHQPVQHQTAAIPSPVYEQTISGRIPTGNQNTVVIWINQDTPLYMTFRTERRERGEEL